jgi:phosphoribosyl-ATP pyrophosphohydrolase
VSDILNELEAVLEERKSADPTSSYVAGLHAQGIEKSLKKLGEESTETVIAAMQGDEEQIVYESADLLFHLMVMLSFKEISHTRVLDELQRRFGLSGLEEKAQRNR